MAEVIAEEAGVRLVFKDVEPTRSSGKGGANYRLTTMRPNQARVFADRDEAVEEYEREVRASMDDPVVRKIFARLIPRR